MKAAPVLEVEPTCDPDVGDHMASDGSSTIGRTHGGSPLARDGEIGKEGDAVAEDTAQAGKAEKVTYHRDRLIGEAGAFFGQPDHVVAGALSMGRNSTKSNFSRDEAEKAIKDYLDHPVEMSYGEFTGLPHEQETTTEEGS